MCDLEKRTELKLSVVLKVEVAKFMSNDYILSSIMEKQLTLVSTNAIFWLTI